MRRTPQPQICKFVARTGKPGILSSDGMFNFDPGLDLANVNALKLVRKVSPKQKTTS